MQCLEWVRWSDCFLFIRGVSSWSFSWVGLLGFSIRGCAGASLDVGVPFSSAFLRLGSFLHISGYRALISGLFLFVGFWFSAVAMLPPRFCECFLCGFRLL